MRLRNRMFLKIYLTLLASLAMVAIVLASLAFLGKFDPENQLEDRLIHFSETLLPATDSKAQWQATIERLADGLSADISLTAADGSLLAEALHKPDRRDTMGQGDRPRHGRTRNLDVTLSDGRTLSVVITNPFQPPRRNTILLILLIAGATGLAAYPVVRNLTRRLEGVRHGMEEWGKGTLSARVEEEGSDEIADVARSFNQAADRIEAMIRAQKNLLANASHELRSPLARLRMAIELYGEGGSVALKDEIIRNLAELDELVEEILIMSRLEGTNPPVLTDQVDLLALAVEEATETGAETIGNPVSINGNGRLLRRLIRNLLQNAARHGAPPVTITIGTASGMALIAVRDHGEGLSELERERIFEPFYRPAGRSKSAGGWGLGLALVRQIADAHGGSVTWRKPDGPGAEFIVSLPLSRA